MTQATSSAEEVEQPVSRGGISARAPRRLVLVEDIPDSLWSGDRMRIPPILASAYAEVIRDRGLADEAFRRQPGESPVGGLTREAAEDHFAKAFDGSSARVQLVALDPKGELLQVNRALALSCLGGSLAILDIPSGAGAFSLSLLCTLAELRSKTVMPRHPLDVTVIAGEINQSATSIAAEMYTKVREALAAQAIHVQLESVQWDVLDRASTTTLVKSFVRVAERAERRLVAVSNFSGFLKQESKFKKAYPQLEEIFRYSSGTPWSTAVWLEPRTNAAQRAIFPRVRSMLSAVQNLLGLTQGSGSGQNESVAESSAVLFVLPLVEGQCAWARVVVKDFALGPDKT